MAYARAPPGQSVEFAEHKYAPGDEIRHIDWKAYGKFDKYSVKRLCMVPAMAVPSATLGFDRGTLTLSGARPADLQLCSFDWAWDERGVLAAVDEDHRDLPVEARLERGIRVDFHLLQGEGLHGLRRAQHLFDRFA